MVRLGMHVITQDREDQMLRLLSATRGLFDFIRVCDGGSKDNTVELCKMFGCEVSERKWDDNMSAQHNVLLDHASEGEWIFVMDDDESPSLLLRAKLRGYAEDGNDGKNYNAVKIPSIMRLNGHADWEVSDLYLAIEKGEQANRFTKTNLFRYDGKVRYEGISHYGLQADIMNSWTIRDMVPAAYLHYKKPIDQVECNIQQAYIYPEMQGLTEEYATPLMGFLDKAGVKSSRGMLGLFDEGCLETGFENFLVQNRDPKRGTISDFYRYYFLYKNPDRLLPYTYLCEHIAEDAATRKFLDELGAYHHHVITVVVGDYVEEWLPIGHLEIKPVLFDIFGTMQVLWNKYPVT